MPTSVSFWGSATGFRWILLGMGVPEQMPANSPSPLSSPPQMTAPAQPEHGYLHLRDSLAIPKCLYSPPSPHSPTPHLPQSKPGIHSVCQIYQTILLPGHTFTNLLPSIVQAVPPPLLFPYSKFLLLQAVFPNPSDGILSPVG